MTHRAQSMTDEEFAAWNEQMAKEYDPDLYHRSENRIVRWVEGRRVTRLLSLLDVRPEHRVLEVGVGAGNILEKVNAKERAGIDLSEHLLVKARARLGQQVHLLHGNAEELGTLIQPHSFDRVYCSEVLEHVQHPERVLQGMSDCLTENGIAVVSVPNESFINFLKGTLKSLQLFRILFPNMADHMEDEWHVHVFGRDLLNRLCSRAFTVEQIVAVPFWFLPIRLVARLHPKRTALSLPMILKPNAAHLRPDGVYVSEDVAGEQAKELSTGVADSHFKNFFKRWPNLYSFLFAVVGPSLLTGITSARFLRTLPDSAKVLNAGSGPRELGPQCINVDLFAFPGVDVVSDLRHLPFKDHTFDAATCEQVLEHVPSPHAVVAELMRVVKPGGLIHIASPFVFPWHPSPSDYTRWTQEGLRSLFPDCAVEREGVMAGPFSALNAFLPALLATVLCFGSRRLQMILQYVFLCLCIPIKLLDLLFAHIPGAELSAANFYLIVRNK